METVVIPYVIPLTSQKPKPLTLVPGDPGSRYKCRQLQVQVVGKSKMIKTVLLNILDVAKDMQVPPSYIGTFMGYDIGAQAKFDPKKPERQQAYISGEHDPKDLSKVMLSFINEVLLCTQCGLPEILIKPEQKSVYGTCRACGSHSELKIQNEKFKRYIINHPPSTSIKGAFAGNKTEAKKEASKTNKEAKEERKKGSKEKIDDSDEDDDGVVWFSDTSEEAARKRREEMLPDSVLHVIKENKEKDSQEKSDKAPANGKDNEIGNGNRVASNKNSVDITEEIAKVLKESSPAEVIDKLQEIKKRGIDDKQFVVHLFDALFEPTVDLFAEIKKKKDILAAVVTSPASQIALLNRIEYFCGKVNPSVVSKVSFIIKELYDQEIVEEESVLGWYEKEKDSEIPTVREQATPIIKWLKEAEEESEEEEED